MKVKITIDGRPLEVDSGLTILQAARQYQIYIPTLCDYQGLSPHGSCRLCIVEVKGNNKTPASCTTPIEEGMSIRTNTPLLRHLRSDILKMMLSEHPIACLLCTERDTCDECMVTLRKASVITGCSSCPKNNQCELQNLVDSIGIIGYNYPIRYRGLEVQRDDPFFDRDYNLCIHCARCLRICENIHLSGTLTYVNKGPDTVVGTAFGRNHLDAGCSFCGACVEVCPTGALTEKTRKWDGAPDDETLTTCPYCSVGCQMWLVSKNQQVIGSLSSQLPGDGHLCVKGKFGIVEFANHPDRLRHPSIRLGKTSLNISWESAISHAAEKLSACMSQQFGMLISASSTNEDLYIAQKFTRTVMGSHNITTPARQYYGQGFQVIPSLLPYTTSVVDIENAETILCLGVETRYAQSILESRLIRAREKGATIISIHPNPHNLSAHADLWLQTNGGEDVEILKWLAELSHAGNDVPSNWNKVATELAGKLEKIIAPLSKSSQSIILVGNHYLQHPNNSYVLSAIKKIAQSFQAKVVMLFPQINFTGSLLMGAYREYFPGGVSSSSKKHLEFLREKWDKGIPECPTNNFGENEPIEQDLRVLYMIGDTIPSPRTRNEFVIYQNIYPANQLCTPDLTLPMAAFSETEGSYLNHQGRLLISRPAVPSIGKAMPSWKILCQIAKAFGASGFDFETVKDIQSEIAQLINEFQPDCKVNLTSFMTDSTEISGSKEFSLNGGKPSNTFYLPTHTKEHTYLGYPLGTWVAGMRVLYPDEINCLMADLMVEEIKCSS